MSYFTDRAAKTMTAAGAPGADVEAIAAWAKTQKAVGEGHKSGVIVDETGKIWADTVRVVSHKGIITDYVGPEEWGITDHLLLQMRELEERAGRKLVRLSFWDLTTGAGN